MAQIKGAGIVSDNGPRPQNNFLDQQKQKRSFDPVITITMKANAVLDTEKNHNFLLENDIQLPKLYCKKAERGPYSKYKRKQGEGSVTNLFCTVAIV